ncbi:hypothetical protein KUL25_09940 [Rhodobacteraceae bacterium N5(2021)]|uniref:D-galactarate dehydratase n=1 Tax=Gymnodinialimonas phycosphaerae TaxID=2841589 RepID=A0A975TY11_9RHOB|nr:hypothetical protein [Gymnodinialimonas phycosphaerae]MBY4893084.1 hypothetical protein [Gymnodinialimonas phycosphaerae]
MTRAISILAVLALAGCANGGFGGLFSGDGPGSGFGGRNAPQEAATGEVITAAVTGEAAAEDIAPADSSTRAAAVAAGDIATGDSVRGFTVASLGDATQPGLWIETPLVDRERVVTVVAPNGTTVEVTARPSGGERGSGSRLSLAAFQALGLNLTSLPTVTVIAD